MEKINLSEHAFYELQSRLRQLGWYFEWTYADQANHMWEDMPSCHEDGPFKGDWIDHAKTLVSYTENGDLDKKDQNNILVTSFTS